MTSNLAFRASVAITKSDTTVYDPKADAIYVGTTGNLVLTINGADFTFANVPVGLWHFGPIEKVKAATTAAALNLLWY